MAKDNIADLFAELWVQLERQRIRLQNAGWQDAEPGLAHHVCSIISEQQPENAVTEIRHILMSGRDREVFRQLEVAQAIDRWFQDMHPRYNVKTLGQQKRRYRDLRTMTGQYNTTSSTMCVVPKSPLRSLTENDILGLPERKNFIKDLFCNLTVLRQPSNPQYRFRIHPVDHDIDDLPRQCRVAFAPLAEDHDDLTFEPRKKNDGYVVHIVPTDENRLADRAYAAIREMCSEGAHIGIFPEFCVTRVVRQSIVRALRKHGSNSELRLVVAGSGLVEERLDGEGLGAETPILFNECEIFDRLGRSLWRQRKVSLHALDPDTLRLIKISPLAEQKHAENGAGGDEFVIGEHDKIGRMIILICEDLAAAPASVVLEDCGPDWIFSPILDFSINEGRWVHQEGWAAARKLLCRVVVANSATMSVRGGAASCGIGLCVDDRNVRQFTIVTRPQPLLSTSVVMLVDWNPTSHPWKMTELRAKDAAERQ